MKRFFIILQWIAVVILAGVLLRAVLTPHPAPDLAREEWSSWNGFHAISFGDIQRSERGGISKDQLKEYLFTLKKEGYQPITAQDALHFLTHQAPLPEKALLILFEGGRKSSILYGTPALRRSGFTALYGVPTCLTREWNAVLVRQGDIKRLDRDPYWSVASMGHQAIRSIPTDAVSQSHFLSRKKWMSGTLESNDEFQKRIQKDYNDYKSYLADRMESPPQFYIYPFSDYGQTPGGPPNAADINREAVTSAFQAAFVRADESFNGLGQDPYFLNRLTVHPSMSPTDLVQELKSFEHRESYTLDGIQDWQVSGPVGIQNQHLRILPQAQAWLKGTARWSHLHLNLTAHPLGPEGALHIYLRSLGPGHYLRIRIAADHCQVQETAGDVLQTLHRQTFEAPLSLPIRMDVRLKANRLWLQLNESTRIGPLPIARRHANGRVGLEADGQTIDIHSFTAEAVYPIVGLASLEALSSAPLPHAVSALVFPWELDPSGMAIRPDLKEQILRLAAEGVDVFPKFSGSLHSKFSLHLRDAGLHYLVKTVVLENPSVEALETATHQGLNVYALMPSDHSSAVLKILDTFPQTQVVLQGEETEVSGTLKTLLKRTPPHRLAKLGTPVYPDAFLIPWLPIDEIPGGHRP